EAPAHVVPIKGEAPNVVGLTPGLASSVAPIGIPVCPTGALGMPSGEVSPSGGSGEGFRGACAKAAPPPKTTAAVATSKRVHLGSTSSSPPRAPSRTQPSSGNATPAPRPHLPWRAAPYS